MTDLPNEEKAKRVAALKADFWSAMLSLGRCVSPVVPPGRTDADKIEEIEKVLTVGP